MTNDALKLTIVNKVGEILKWDKNTCMESINEWRCFGPLTGWCGTPPAMGHGLALIQANNTIYGLLLSTSTRKNEGSTVFYDFDESFAFNCGSNSHHLLSTSDTKDIDTHMEYSVVRLLTDNERKVGQKDDEIYRWCIGLSPLQVRGIVTKNQYMSETIQWHVRYGHGDKDKYVLLRNSEMW
eukprot:404950_1